MIGLNFFISPNETMPTGAYVLRQRVKWGDHRILLREIFKVYFMKYLWRERERENINEWICTVHTYKYILVLLHFNKSFKYFCGFFKNILLLHVYLIDKKGKKWMTFGVMNISGLFAPKNKLVVKVKLAFIFSE